MSYNQESCQEYSRSESKVSLLLNRDGRNYAITVATPTYLERLRQHNQGLSEEERLDDLAFPLEPIPPTEDLLCQHLAKVPMEILSPYLTEQH